MHDCFGVLFDVSDFRFGLYSKVDPLNAQWYELLGLFCGFLGLNRYSGRL